MSVIYYNPENALKRANEFLELGKYEEAINCLCDVLRNKKSRILKCTHEAIVNKLLEICVDNKISAPAKDGLYLYRNICLGTNVMSWEGALKKLLLLAEQKIEKAEEELPTSATDYGTLDQMTSRSLFGYVSKEGNENKERRDIIFLGWIKFMLECYHICLELLKRAQTDKFYHQIAQNAFMFCLKHSLETELGNFCKMFRTHFDRLFKRHLQTPLPPITNTETLTLYLETGMIQLDCALQMELWKEAFRTTEDIHLVIGMLKKPVNYKIVACFYEKLAAIFWKSNDLLYHAAALYRYFLFSREHKNLTGDDILRISSRVVVAVLSIHFVPHNPVVDLIIENDTSVIAKRHRILSTLLNFPTKPTRNILLKSLEQQCIIQSASPEIQSMYQLLEHEVEPLKLSANLISLLSSLSERKAQENLEQYFSPIYNIVVIRLLSQFSKIYKTLTFKKFRSIVPFIGSFDLERLVVNSARRYNIPLRIDHVNQCLRFYSDFSLFENKSLIDGPENAILQADSTSNYLSLLFNSQKKMSTYLKPEVFKSKDITIREQLKERYLTARRADRKEILERSKRIDKHKAMLEKMRLKKEEYERKLVVDKQLKYEAAERERLLKEAEERAVQRSILQVKEIKKQIFLEKMESLKNTEFGQIIEKLELTELESVNLEILWRKHIEHISKKKKEFQARLQRQERAIDHMERAKRKEEIPLLMTQYHEDRVSGIEMWENDERLKIQAAHEERSRVIHIRDKFLAMKKYLINFVVKVKENKKQEYNEKCAEFQQLLETERTRRLKERALKRKNQRRQAWLKEQEKCTKQNQITVTENSEPREKCCRERSPIKEYDQSTQHKVQAEQKDSDFDAKRSKCSVKKKNEQEGTQAATRNMFPENPALVYQLLDRRNMDQSPIKRKFNDYPERIAVPKYILKRKEHLGISGGSSNNVSGPSQRGTENPTSKQTNRCLEHARRGDALFDKHSKPLEPSLSKTEPRTKIENQFPENRNQDDSLFRSAKDSNFIRGEAYNNAWPKKEATQSNLGSSTEFSRSKYDRHERIQPDDDESQKFDSRRSCTPWAKQKRKDDTK